jgi:hypothetical protein
VAECEAKLVNLHNSFSRQTSASRNPSGSGAKKKRKPWYLSGAMPFVGDFERT